MITQSTLYFTYFCKNNRLRNKTKNFLTASVQHFHFPFNFLLSLSLSFSSILSFSLFFSHTVYALSINLFVLKNMYNVAAILRSILVIIYNYLSLLFFAFLKSRLFPFCFVSYVDVPHFMQVNSLEKLLSFFLVKFFKFLLIYLYFPHFNYF